MSPSNVPAHVASGNRKAQRCFCLSGAKGKNREPGSHKISVRKFMSDRKCIHVSPWGQKFRFLSTSNVPAHVASGNRKAQRCFCLSGAKGKNREPGSHKISVRKFMSDRKCIHVSPWGQKFRFLSTSNVPAHVASGNRKAQRCFCLSGAKGKNREPGSHKISVRKFMSDRKCIHVSPWGQKFRFLSTSNVPAYVAPGNRKSVAMFAASANRELGSRASCATAQDDL